MKPSKISNYQRALLMFAVLPLLLALIGWGLAWFVLGDNVLLWLRAMAVRLIIALSLFAFGGLVTSRSTVRLLGPILLDLSQERESKTDNEVMGAAIAFIPVLLACAFLTYLSAPSERSLIQTATVLIVGGLGTSVAFGVSFVYVSVAQMRLRRRDQ